MCQRASGTPPTQVETTRRPQLAASSAAMQKDSVSERLRKMWPELSTCNAMAPPPLSSAWERRAGFKEGEAPLPACRHARAF